MANLQFLHYKTNLFGVTEVCLNVDNLLRELPDLTECYKVEFTRTMYNYKKLPFHAVVAVAPIFEKGDQNYNCYSEHVHHLPRNTDLSKTLCELVESLFSQVPQPAPRYSVRRWFNIFSNHKFFFNLDGRIYYGVIIGGRGYQDKIERPLSINRASGRKIVTTAIKSLAEAISSHYPKVASHFDPHCVKMNQSDDVMKFSKSFLSSSPEFIEMSQNFELQLKEVDEQIKALTQKRHDLGIEFGIKTRRMVREKMDQMEADDGCNKEQVMILRKRLEGAPIGVWSF